MHFYCFRTNVIRNVALMTDDPKKLPGQADLRWQPFVDFDEADPVRKAFLRDEFLQAAKDAIARDGFCQMAPGASIIQ